MRMLRALARSIAVAFVVLGSVTASAQAYTLAVSPGGAVTMPSTGSVSFTGSEITLACNLTLSSTLGTGPTRLTAGAALGSVRSVSFGSCSGGSISAYLGLPWSITFQRAAGTLPSEVTSFTLQIEGFAHNLAVFGGFVNCLYRGNLSAALSVARARTLNVYTSGSSSLSGTVALVSGGFGCPSSQSVTGTLGLSPTQTLTVAGEAVESTLAFEPAGSIALESLDAITFTDGVSTMACDWTLSGTLTSGALRLAEGTSIGSISSTARDHCSGGSVAGVLSTPWTIKYVRATGTLPREATAVTIKVEGYAVNLRTFGRHVGCLYRGALIGTLELSGANAYPTGLLRLTESRLAFVSGEAGCLSSVTATGTFWLSPEQSIRFE